MWITFSIIAVLVYFLLEALQRETVRAERAAFDKVVAEMRAATVLKTSALVAADKWLELKNFVNSDPMDWMNPPPVNYSGKINGNPEHISAGHWFYSVNEQLIVYRVRNDETMVLIQGEEPGYIRFRVAMEFVDVNRNGIYDERKDRPKGLTLERVLPSQSREP